MNNEKEFTPEERSAMCDSIDESQNGADSTSKAVPPQIQWFASDDGELTIITPDGKKRTLADHAAEIERLSKERDDALANADFWELELNNFRRNAAHRAEQLAKEKVEAAESKLSQLQLTISFFASVIKSGESWSETCQEHLDKARGGQQ